ncbi:MAG: vitamin B12-dependent ribonucleotide reductase, partial [Actinomycetota bacterium]
SKQGSTLAGIMDAFAKSISYGLQYGVPLRAFVEAFINTRFEPAGMTDDSDIRMASSIVDYLFRRLAVEYLSAAERAELGIYTREERMQPPLPGVEESVVETTQGTDVMSDPKTIPSASDLIAQIDAGSYAAPTPAKTGAICSSCGSANMQRAGACYVCGDCGSSSGCS